MLSLLVLALAVEAVPAKRGMWTTIRLADGTEVRVEKMGDEHQHWLQAADGTCYVASGDAYVQQDSEALQARREARMAQRNAKRKAIYASTTDGLGQKGMMSMGAVPSIGAYTIPVVMVQFSDLKFKSTTTVSKMTRYYNEAGYHDEAGCVGSVCDFFAAQSGGQFVPTFDVVGIVTLSKSYKYYGGNDKDGNDENLDQLPGDVVEAAVSQLGVDFSKFVVPAGDKNHKAGVPLMAMFYAGRGEATEYSGADDYIWPCEWDAEEDPVGKGTYQGVRFNSFFVGNELNTGGSKLMGMGVFCHEFGHALGLPDFYVTDYSYENDDAFGHWSIMDCGAYVSDSYAPVGYTAYEKSYMGWLELKEIGSAKQVTLQSPLDLAENSAYIVRNSSTETFIFENRQPGTWYPSSFGSGVLVTRIAYNKTQWNWNTLNNMQSKKRACVLTANGAKLSYSASSAHLYGNSRTAISSLQTLSGTTKTIGITDVTKNSDGTITLTLNGGDDPDPQPEPGKVLFYESFNQCNGKGGNDGEWNGSIASATFSPDNDGWEAPKGSGAYQCAKFGTGSIDGSAQTPSIEIDGEATLTFRAGAWNASKDGTSLQLGADGGTVTPSMVTLTKGDFDDFTAKVTASGTVNITFLASKGRFFLDEVKLTGKASTDISEVRAGNVKTGRIYTLDGRYVGTDLNVLGRGLYIVDGKKVIR